jgi:hypothetical protein
MNVRCGIVAGGLALALPLAVRAQDEVKVRGRVLNAAGKPVVGAEVATFWNAENNKMTPHKAATTDAEGRFALAVTFYGRSQGLLALDKEHRTGGLVLVEPKDAEKPVEVKLASLIHLHGQFSCKELNKRPSWTNVYIMSGEARFAMCSSREASFSFDLPPGTYKFWGYGRDVESVKKDITLKADERNMDLKTIDLPATILAKHKGKALPAWHVTDARGVKKDVKLSDFKGKWVFLEFWGFW